MAEFLDFFPSRIVGLIAHPFTNVFVGMLGSYTSCLSLIWYYYPNKIAPVLVASGFSEKLSSIEFLSACLVTATISSLLLLDLLFDVWSAWDDYRTKQVERNKRALMAKPETEIEKSSEIDDYDIKEFFTRFMYIISCLVASISMLAGRPAYRCILGIFRLICSN